MHVDNRTWSHEDWAIQWTYYAHHIKDGSNSAPTHHVPNWWHLYEALKLYFPGFVVTWWTLLIFCHITDFWLVASSSVVPENRFNSFFISRSRNIWSQTPHTSRANRNFCLYMPLTVRSMVRYVMPTRTEISLINTVRRCARNCQRISNTAQ